MTQNEVSEAMVRWLEQKRGRDRTSAAAISVLALSSGTAVFLLMSLLIFAVLSMFVGPFFHSVAWLGLIAMGLAGWGFFAT